MTHTEWLESGKNRPQNNERVTLTDSDFKVVLDDTGSCTTYIRINGLKGFFAFGEDLDNMIHTATRDRTGLYEASHPTIFSLK